MISSENLLIETKEMIEITSSSQKTNLPMTTPSKSSSLPLSPSNSSLLSSLPQSSPSQTLSPSLSAAITHMNIDGTCTIRIDEDGKNEARFIKGIFQIPSQYQSGEHVEIVFPNSSNWIPGIISRRSPDGKFIVRYQDGKREIKLDPTHIKKSISFPPPEKKITLTRDEIEKGCETIDQLRVKLSKYDQEGLLLRNHLETTQNIANQFLISLSQHPKKFTPLPTEQLNELRRLRDENSKKQLDEIKQTSISLEKRIEQMKYFTLSTHSSMSNSSSNYLAQSKISHHKHLHHYPYLVFLPFRFEILKKYEQWKQRYLAAFVLKRFFRNVLAWIRVVLAIKTLTRKRMRYKKRYRREHAAIIIQCAIRQRYALSILKKRKYSAIIIQKAMLKKRNDFLNKKKFEERVEFMRIIIRSQRNYRWRRNQKLRDLQKRIKKENNSARKIQKLFKNKLKRPDILPDIIEALTDSAKDSDSNDLMILRKVLKPPLSSCRGYWIEMDDEDTTSASLFSDLAGREGLIEGVDYSTGMMVVDFGHEDQSEEYEVDYNSEHIRQWFKMTNKREQDTIIYAATKLQNWARTRLKYKRNIFASTLSAINSKNSLKAPDHNPDDDLMILRLITRPPLQHAPGYWISFNFEPEREALIEKVHLRTRVMTIEYNDNDEISEVGYDHPDLSWFKMSTQREEQREIDAVIKIQKVMRGALARMRLSNSKSYKILSGEADIKDQKRKAAEKIQAIYRGRLVRNQSIPTSTPKPQPEDETVELQAVDQIPIIENCPGYWIIRQNENAEGKIESIDLGSCVMKVLYENESMDIPYYESGLTWYEEEKKERKELFTLSKKPSLDGSIGYYLKIPDEEELDSDRNNQRKKYDLALVVDINNNHKMLKVQFIQKISCDGRVICDEIEDEVPYTSPHLQWLKGR